MITKTSFLIIGLITSLAVAGFSTDVFAFEPTDKEQKIIDGYAKILEKINKRSCDDAENRHDACDKLEERERKLLFKLNDMGIYADNQSPNLEHLTEEYNGTREAARAGIQPIDEEPSTSGANTQDCNCDNDKTMYVKSAYKDQYQHWTGLWLWSHYAWLDSSHVKTGESTIAPTFPARWSGVNNGLVPYCHTSSVDLPANASYDVKMQVFSASKSWLGSFDKSETSYFVWYDTHDKIEHDHVINNQSTGMDIACSISKVTVN